MTVTIEEQLKTAAGLADTIAGQLTSLGEQLVRETIFAAYNEHTASIKAEIESLTAEASSKRAAYAELEPRVEAKDRATNHQCDVAISEGRDQDAEQLRGELASLQQDLNDLRQRSKACDARIEELRKEIVGIARATFNENFEALRVPLIKIQTAMVDMLGGTWSALQEYAGTTGNDVSNNRVRPLIQLGHKRDLTARETGPEKDTFYALASWFA